MGSHVMEAPLDNLLFLPEQEGADCRVLHLPGSRGAVLRSGNVQLCVFVSQFESVPATAPYPRHWPLLQ